MGPYRASSELAAALSAFACLGSSEVGEEVQKQGSSSSAPGYPREGGEPGTARGTCQVFPCPAESGFPGFLLTLPPG